MSEYTRWQRIMISFDQAVGTILFSGCGSDETISAYCWRTDKTRWIKFIDWLFYDGHCRDSYISEKCGKHLAPEYRQKFDEESA